MGKNTKHKNKRKHSHKAAISKLNNSRNGGQIALIGYSYQLLYSCFIILNTSNINTYFQFEGVEDIDSITCAEGDEHISNIQLKYSANRQDASYLKSVLKNFLEAYLLDSNRKFILVYDFDCAKGNLQQLLDHNLSNTSHDYWESVVKNIQTENESWNWKEFNFDTFISKLSFERVDRKSLADKIEAKLIDKYDISTDNISLYMNSIKVFSLEKMEAGNYVRIEEVDKLIELVKDDISKGYQNPAHSWIRKLDYSAKCVEDGRRFFEGKKATPADIANGLPIRRPLIEQSVIKSISNNEVTVIKASSGQGKTTLALQVSYVLNIEYSSYQLTWCNDVREIGNIVQYFKTRIRLGEKVMILIDNLDNNFGNWNQLVQGLQEEVPCHYKILITTREANWYNYCGDLSNINSINIVKPVLSETEAEEIFVKLKELPV